MKTKTKEMADRETRAWDAQDAEVLVSIFHPDMVWPWPPSSHAHDPVDWIFPQGRFNRRWWKESWQELFDTCDLIHNHSKTGRIVMSAESEGDRQ